MQIDKKYINRIAFFFGLITILANIIALVVPSIIRFPLADVENVARWEAFLDSNILSNISLVPAFLIPVLFFFIFY